MFFPGKGVAGIFWGLDSKIIPTLGNMSEHLDTGEVLAGNSRRNRIIEVLMPVQGTFDTK